MGYFMFYLFFQTKKNSESKESEWKYETRKVRVVIVPEWSGRVQMGTCWVDYVVVGHGD